MRIDATKLKATIDDVEYEWCGGFGVLIESRERGVQKGQLRAIGEVILYAYRIDNPIFDCPTVGWGVVGEIDSEWIRDFKKAMFRTDL